MILETTPAPTVLPPSRIANLKPLSIAIGANSVTLKDTLSPGITISVPAAAGTEMVMPGDNVSFKVTLLAPIAMESGLRFAIREGGRTVGAGVVSSIIE